MTTEDLREIPPGEAPWDLLLLADPNREKVGAYLLGSRCFAIFSGGRPLGVAVAVLLEEGVYELMNLAVEPSAQEKGLGTRLLRHVVAVLGREGARRLELGTGTFGYQLRFYQRHGFRVRGVERDFFLTHYPEPIFEEGIQLKDMLRLALDYPEEAPGGSGGPEREGRGPSLGSAEKGS